MDYRLELDLVLGSCLDSNRDKQRKEEVKEKLLYIYIYIYIYIYMICLCVCVYRYTVQGWRRFMHEMSRSNFARYFFAYM